MKLDSWLQEKGITAKGFAVEVGLTGASISRLRRGLQRPTLDTIEAIRTATDGAVDAVDFVRAPT